MAGHVTKMEEVRDYFIILTANPIETRPLGSARHRWEDDIRKYLKEMDASARNWIYSAQNRDYWRVLANLALNLQIL